jgi:four helix bundle protein
MTETCKFQKLKVYQLALNYVDVIYNLNAALPDSENFNLSSQIMRTSTSIILKIAEGSTGQSDAEQSRFLGHAIRSFLETIACLDLIELRNYIPKDEIASARLKGHEFFVKLQAFRRSLNS